MQVPHARSFCCRHSLDMCRLEAPQRSAAAAAASAAAGLLSAVMNYSAVSDMVSCWVILTAVVFPQRVWWRFALGSTALTVLQARNWLLRVALRGKTNLSPAGWCHLSILNECASFSTPLNPNPSPPLHNNKHRLSRSATSPPSACPARGYQPSARCSTPAAAATAAATMGGAGRPAAA